MATNYYKKHKGKKKQVKNIKMSLKKKKIKWEKRPEMDIRTFLKKKKEIKASISL